MDKESLRICIVTNGLEEPIDEGIKKTTYELTKHLSRKLDCLVAGSNIPSEIGINFKMNKVFFSTAFFRTVRSFRPEGILYIPSSSLTLASFIRAKVLSSIGAPVAIIGLQPRRYSWRQLKIIKLIKPDLIFVQSKKSVDFWVKNGFKACFMKSGVDLNKFKPAKEKTKLRLRKKYGLPLEDKVLLHVGHIKEDRGIEELLQLKCEGMSTVIVSSTSTEQDTELLAKIKKQGCIVISRYMNNIEHLYQMADLYVFPVIRHDAAIEFPLSVLEAMACGTPVLTTPFGGLADAFAESDHVRFYRSVSEGRKKLNELLRIHANSPSTRPETILDFTWENIYEGIVRRIEELV